MSSGPRIITRWLLSKQGREAMLRQVRPLSDLSWTSDNSTELKVVASGLVRVLRDPESTPALSGPESSFLRAVGAETSKILDEMSELESFLLLENKDGTEGAAQLAEAAREDLVRCCADLEDRLRKGARLLLPEHSFDSRAAELEVQAGAGGQEATLFASEIFEMYRKYAQRCGHQVAVRRIDKVVVGPGLDGVASAAIKVSGPGAFRLLKHECGVHRVQRVPSQSTGTKSDRLQTSTCSVCVLPDLDDDDNLGRDEVPERDLKYEYVRSSGAGGQNVNKTESACRLTHLPTGLSIKCQDERSQSANRKIALQRMRTLLFRRKFEETMQMTAKVRKSQIGNMDRNEKIRTYNFARHTLTDHRLGEVRQLHDMTDFLDGRLGFDILVHLKEKLQAELELKSLKDFLDSLNAH